MQSCDNFSIPKRPPVRVRSAPPGTRRKLLKEDELQQAIAVGAPASGVVTQGDNKHLETFQLPQFKWTFLTATESNHRVVSQRPSSSSGSRARAVHVHELKEQDGRVFTSLVPKRPATSRERTPHGGASGDSNASGSAGVPLSQATRQHRRAMKEALRRELEQIRYTDPLLAKDIELRRVSLQRQLATSSNHLKGSRNVHFYRQRAFQARTQGNFVRAAQEYARLVELQPNDFESRFQLAWCLVKQDKLKEAAKQYSVAIQLNDSNAFAYFNLGNVHMRLMQYDNAIDYYTKAIKIQRKIAVFYLERGNAYRKKGDFEKAAHDYVLYGVHKGNSSTTDCSAMDSGGCSVFSPTKAVGDVCYTCSPVYEMSRTKCGSQEDNQELEEANSLEKNPWDPLEYQQVMNIAVKAPQERTEEEVLYLMDHLHNRFVFSDLLLPEMCREFSEALVGIKGVAPNSVLIRERGHGQHVFLLMRGQVSIFKHALFDDATDGVKESCPQSWEEDASQVWCFAGSSDQVKVLDLARGSIFGQQGRLLSGTTRAYSAVVTKESDLLTVTWSQLSELERIHHERQKAAVLRFFTNCRFFLGFTRAEREELALRAECARVIGSRVVCKEGQALDGVLFVRRGKCQLMKGPLPFATESSVSSAAELFQTELEAAYLCDNQAAITRLQVNGKFNFSQLEFHQHPLGFLVLNSIFYGYLTAQTVQQAGILSMERGDFLFACGKGLNGLSNSHASGAQFARSSLLSFASTELVFLRAGDLAQVLCSKSKESIRQLLVEEKVRHENATAQLRQMRKQNSNWVKFRRELVASFKFARSRRSLQQEAKEKAAEAATSSPTSLSLVKSAPVISTDTTTVVTDGSESTVVG